MPTDLVPRRRLLPGRLGVVAWLLAALLLARGGPPALAETPALAVVPRSGWNARPPLPGMVPQTIRGIIVHHTGVRSNPRLGVEAKMRGLQSFSQMPAEVSPGRMKPAWPDVPYHFYIDVSGRIAEGRDPGHAGDTNTGYDPRGYLQIAVEGDFETEQPDPRQLAALKQLLASALARWRLPVTAVSGHDAHASTDCPGKNLRRAMPGLLSGLGRGDGRP